MHSRFGVTKCFEAFAIQIWVLRAIILAHIELANAIFDDGANSAIIAADHEECEIWCARLIESPHLISDVSESSSVARLVVKFQNVSLRPRAIIVQQLHGPRFTHAPASTDFLVVTEIILKTVVFVSRWSSEFQASFSAEVLTLHLEDRN